MKNETLNYYNENAKEYFEITKMLKTSDIYTAFLNSVKSGGKILDLGCGSGRDSLYFKNAGYDVTAVDGSVKLAKEAEKLINQDVIVSKFEDLELNQKFDGIWACASLLHVKRENIEEIRLRVNKPLIINGDLKDYFYNDKTKKLDMKMDNAYIVTKDDIEQTFQMICKYSIHSFMDDIKKGFITLRGGHRVGIVGKAIVENGKVENIKHISSLNIRISKEVLNCSDKVMDHIIKGPTKINNTIIISPPQCGKTTLLRDMVRNLSNGNEKFNFKGVKVALIDERNEIAGSYLGVPQMDVGIRTDIIETCPKDIGIMMVLRSMSPNVIVTDEIGTEKDIKALYTALNGGVGLITTVHGDSIEDIRSRKELKNLLDEELFKKVILLSAKRGPGTIEKIYDLQEKRWYFAN